MTSVGIVGLGLIGGSLARAVKAAGFQVLGDDIQPSVLLKARLAGIVDEALTDERLSECGVILLGLYPSDTLKWLEQKAPLLAPSTVVMDTCGVKQAVCAPAWSLARSHRFTFVGGHPMEGAAKIGFDNSDGGLFRGASIILCPDEDLSIEQMKKLKDVLDSAGFSRYEISTPEHHDRMIALTSQLAHVVSSAFVKAPLASKHHGYSAGSFRDMTRVAYLNEAMWTELFMENRTFLLGEINALIERISLYRDVLMENDEIGLNRLLKEGREQKEALGREEAHGKRAN